MGHDHERQSTDSKYGRRNRLSNSDRPPHWVACIRWFSFAAPWRALYSCKYCAEDYSWPAEDLNWSGLVNGWVCNHCWESDDHGDPGVRLDREIQRRLSNHEQMARGLMRTCYDEANRLANHGSSGLEKLVMTQLYAAANAAKEKLND